MKKTVFFLTSLQVAVCVIQSPLQLNAQTKYAIWEGAYTSAQAERGWGAYKTHCTACHAEDIRGGKAPTLMGDVFMLHWETKTVGEFFQKIRDTMPKRGTSSDLHPITEKDKLDIVAYLLQRNGFPAGSRELTDDSALLGSLQIIPQNGPSPPRNGSMVHAIGCLEGRDDSWTITRSGGPRVTMFDALTTADREAAKSAPPGSQTVPLVSVFPSPVQYSGHKMRATGLLIVNGADVRINVLSMETLASTCF